MQAIESGSSMKRPYIVDTFYAPAEAPKNDWFITWFWIGFVVCGIAELVFAVVGFLAALRWVGRSLGL